MTTSEATAQEDEDSLDCAIRHLLSNESLADVNLQGTDGITLPAHRLILAARSQVFEKLLFGNFAEASNSLVRIGYDGRVLQAIVEYCYTDKVALLCGLPPQNLSFKQIEMITSLAAAADYFCFPKLCKKVTDFVLFRMDKKKQLALGFFIAANDGGTAPKILRAAMDTMQNHFEDCQLKDSKDFLGHLSPVSLEKIVSNEAILAAEEIDLFNLVASWVDCNCDSRGDESAGNAIFTREKRKEVASELVEKHICLEKIMPSHLLELIEPSGIVSDERILETYKTHSLCMESTVVPPYKKTKRVCWESSNQSDFTSTDEGHRTELLQCRHMGSGIHIWSIKLVADCKRGCWLGVALVGDPFDRDKWLGRQASGWVFGNGRVLGDERKSIDFYGAYHDDHKTRDVHWIHKEGSIVKFRLDLTQQGTLSASVDGWGELLLFDNMLMIGEKKVDRTFVPAASLRAPGALRFLGFHCGG
jgi:hypothetical protein